MRNMNIKPGEKRMPIEEIIDKWPDAILHYPTYMSMSLRDEKRLKDICVRWYQSGEFPAQILNFAYNELASADKDAIIFMVEALTYTVPECFRMRKICLMIRRLLCILSCLALRIWIN